MTSSPARQCSFDPYSPASGAIQALASGALALINPADYKLSTRRWVRLGLSAGTGLIAGAAIRAGMKRSIENAEKPSAGSEATGHDGAATAPGEAPGVVHPDQPSDAASARKVSTRMAATIGGLFAATCYGSFVVGEWVDARVHNALVRGGVAHPRIVMAVGTAAVSYGLFELDRRTRDVDASDAEALAEKHA